MASNQQKEYTLEEVARVRLTDSHRIAVSNALASTTRRVMWYVPTYLAISVEQLIHGRMQWITVDSRVYDVSKFAYMHPGGAAVLLVDSIGINPSPNIT